MKKSVTNILLIVMSVLLALMAFTTMNSLKESPFPGILTLTALVTTLMYAFWLYKVPHGYILKYAMLLFALANILIGTSSMMGTNDYIEVLRIITCAGICYGAGRLNRIDQNKYLFPIIVVVSLAVSILKFVFVPKETFLENLSYFNFAIIFTAILIAYFVRFSGHIKAGKDAPQD